MPVTSINVFAVPAARESEFVQWWRDVKEHITKPEEFISGTFHKSLKPDSRFNSINLAIWENETLYWKAYEKSVTAIKEKLGLSGVDMRPALYHVAFEN